MYRNRFWFIKTSHDRLNIPGIWTKKIITTDPDRLFFSCVDTFSALQFKLYFSHQPFFNCETEQQACEIRVECWRHHRISSLVILNWRNGPTNFSNKPFSKQQPWNGYNCLVGFSVKIQMEGGECWKHLSKTHTHTCEGYLFSYLLCMC